MFKDVASSRFNSLSDQALKDLYKYLVSRLARCEVYGGLYGMIDIEISELKSFCKSVGLKLN